MGQMTQPTVSKHCSPKDRLQSHQLHLTMSQCKNMQYTMMHIIHTYTKMNLSTVKWAQWDKTQSREQLHLFICVQCTVHNCWTQYCTKQTDNFASYPPDNHHCSDDVYLRKGRIPMKCILRMKVLFIVSECENSLLMKLLMSWPA